MLPQIAIEGGSLGLFIRFAPVPDNYNKEPPELFPIGSAVSLTIETRAKEEHDDTLPHPTPPYPKSDPSS
jgi:hypothetical protein